jgi:uncharacterized SAM-binding protein YcdF (DUF218 family)
MFLYLSKLLPIFLYPFGLSLLLIGLGGWKRWSRLSWLALGILLIFSAPVVSSALMLSLEGQYPQQTLQQLPQAQTMVILGGLMHSPSAQHPLSELVESSDRLLYALRLYRAKKASRILISGGNIDFLGGTQQQPEAQAARALLVEWGIPPSAIQIEDRSRNTFENAQFVAKMISRQESILLVTSGFHMPRAMAVFRKVGFTAVTPAPTDFFTGWATPDPIFQWLPAPDALDHASIALKEWIGLWVYRWQGWAV